MMAKASENKCVGVNCGKLDQSYEVLCKKDSLLYLDCADDSYEIIPWTGKGFGIAVFFSGLESSLANSAYNLRQDECKTAVYDLLACAGLLPYGKIVDTRLRDVLVEVLDAYKERLPENFRRRAMHYFSEFERAEEKGADAWKAGDVEGYGQLVFASGRSSVENYECGCPELITLYEIMTRTDGIYGGRFSGAGFKGCCMALIDPARQEELVVKVGREYLKVYPALEGKYSAHVCAFADGVRLDGGQKL